MYNQTRKHWESVCLKLNSFADEGRIEPGSASNGNQFSLRLVEKQS